MFLKNLLAPHITLHVRDTLAGRRKMFTVPATYTRGNFEDHLYWNGFLPDRISSPLSWSIPELEQYSFRDQLKDTGLRSGDTLHVVYRDADLIRNSGAADRLYQKYDVVVRWTDVTSDNRWSYETRHVCSGYDTKESIEEMLSRENGSNRRIPEFSIDESCWPMYRIGPDGSREQVKYLCQLSRKKTVLLSAQMNRVGFLTLYGCPTAKIFTDSDKQQRCSVEIVRYE